jgi:type II secretory pathway component PulJ
MQNVLLMFECTLMEELLAEAISSIIGIYLYETIHSLQNQKIIFKEHESTLLKEKKGSQRGIKQLDLDHTLVSIKRLTEN